MKVLFAGSECVPFIKTGGLADVLGALPKALHRADPTAEIKVILPLYRCIPEGYRVKMKEVTSFRILFGGYTPLCRILSLVMDGVTYLFVENEDHFGVDKIYGDGLAEGYRFAFYCRAVAEYMRTAEDYPDVLHLNDWQTGLLAAMLRTQYPFDEKLTRMKMVYSIHNLKYQGFFGWGDLNPVLGFDDSLMRYDCLEYHGMLSCAKGGLVFADAICAVSPSYADEIRMEYYGEGLDGLLRYRGSAVTGILNGIDTDAYNPAADSFLKYPYDRDSMAGKAKQKKLLQKELGLEVRADVPIVAMITRLTGQKGLDLVECALRDMMDMDIQFVILGDGEKRYVDLCSWAAGRFPGKMACYIGMNEGLAHRIYAGADIFLMPSEFEPCGLSQMISMRYGTIPVVRETGGLRDTVEPYNKYTGTGLGFSFMNYNAHEMRSILADAVKLYYTEEHAWKCMQQRGMEQDFSWNVPAKQYLKLYEKLLG